MGFLDDVAADLETSSEGGDYVNGAEKRDIVAKGIPFTITALERGKTRFNDDAFTLNIQLAGEARSAPLPSRRLGRTGSTCSLRRTS